MVNVLACLRKQRDGRGLNPGPPDPEFEFLTARPHTSRHQTVYVYTNVVSLPIFLALKNISSTSCTNQDQNCLYWANTDECCKNPAYMLEYCCASCKAKGNQVIFKIGSQMVSALRLQCIVDEKFNQDGCEA